MWERAWTIPELRASTKDWTLASDCGLYFFLKDFSQVGARMRAQRVCHPTFAFIALQSSVVATACSLFRTAVTPSPIPCVQHILSRTSALEKMVDSLNTETKATGTRMHNVFDEFLMLSNSQFIENRVYEEVSTPPLRSHAHPQPQLSYTSLQSLASCPCYTLVSA